VQYYKTNSLERSFPEVPIVLGLPYKEAVSLSPEGRFEFHSLLTAQLVHLQPSQYDMVTVGLGKD